jgi:pimeloyl-ACP methyl ester carboxylesterase
VQFRTDELIDFITQAAASGSGTVADAALGAFASAAATSSGQIVDADEQFQRWLGEEELSDRLRSGTGDASKPQILILAGIRSSRPVAVAAAQAAWTRHWPLDPRIRAQLDSGRASHAVLAFAPQDDNWRRVAEALGLTSSEIRLIAALTRFGDLRSACQQVGCAYETGRKLVASAMRRTGTTKQTELVALALKTAGGAIAPPVLANDVLADLFLLSKRQAFLARAVAWGETRDAAADKVGTSSSRAKSDLRTVFTACGVATAVDLARIVLEVDALAGLAQACDVDLSLVGAGADPLRLLKRADRVVRIAFADFGPISGMPVLVTHTTTGGRAQSPALIKCLQAAGWRPICIERPGYGLTDMLAGNAWANAAADVIEVLDTLGVDRVAIFARGGAQTAIACAQALGERVCAGVLQGPDPPPQLDRSHQSMLGRSKHLFYGNEAILHAFAGMLSRRTSSVAIERMMRSTTKGCAADEAVFTVPSERDALVRGARQSAYGLDGFVAEQVLLSRGEPLPVLAVSEKWSIIWGGQDKLYNAEDSREYWLDILPGCRFEILADGGRYIHISHTAEMVAALGNAEALAAQASPDSMGCPSD